MFAPSPPPPPASEGGFDAEGGQGAGLSVPEKTKKSTGTCSVSAVSAVSQRRPLLGIFSLRLSQNFDGTKFENEKNEINKIMRKKNLNLFMRNFAEHSCCQQEVPKEAEEEEGGGQE